jgi:hypothetical protein
MGLCTSNGWLFEYNAQMGGKSEAARMSNTLTIDEQKIRLLFQLLVALENDRDFPEREKSGNVWYTIRSDSTCLLYQFQLRKCKNAYTTNKPVMSDSNINASNVIDRVCEFLKSDLVRKSVLMKS